MAMSALSSIDHLNSERRIIIRNLFGLIYTQQAIYYPTLSTAWSASITIERSCYDECVMQCKMIDMRPTFDNKDFVARYNTACALVMAHLQVDGLVDSTYFVDQLKRDAIDLTKIGQMTSEQLCPRASEQERTIIARRLEQRIEKKVCRAYKCHKCGGNETTLEEQQLRGLDEPPTVTVYCENSVCKNKWRLQ